MAIHGWRVGVVFAALAVTGWLAITAHGGEWKKASSSQGDQPQSTSRSAKVPSQPAPPPAEGSTMQPADSPSRWDSQEMWEESYPPGPIYGPGLGLACGGWYADFEALFWWRSGQDIPALVTTSDDGTPQANAGVLGLPTTTVLLGNHKITDENRMGGRVSVGTWFDPYQVNGAVIRFFSLKDDQASYRYSTDDYSILGRPFFNVSTSAEDARLVGYPGISTGWIEVDARSDFAAGDVVLRMMLTQGNCWRLDLIGGYQMARIDESLRIRDELTSTDTAGNIPVGTRIAVEDYFATRNQYHAGVVGAIWEYDRGTGALSVRASVGLGNMREEVTIRGQTTTTPPAGVATTVDSGFLTQPSNIGTYVQNEFAAVPELAIRARWYLSDHLAISAGYNFIYYSKVVRPGEQIDRVLNLTQVPGPIVGDSRPAFSFQSGSLFLHGLTVGLHAEF